jgi:hypothetical protein
MSTITCKNHTNAPVCLLVSACCITFAADRFNLIEWVRERNTTLGAMTAEHTRFAVGDIVVGTPRVKGGRQLRPADYEIGCVCVRLRDQHAPWKVQWLHLDAKRQYEPLLRTKLIAHRKPPRMSSHAIWCGVSRLTTAASCSQHRLAALHPRSKHEQLTKIGHIDLFDEWFTNMPPLGDVDLSQLPAGFTVIVSEQPLQVGFTKEDVRQLALACRTQWKTFYTGSYYTGDVSAPPITCIDARPGLRPQQQSGS